MHFKLKLAVIESVNLLNEVAIRALHCTPQEECNELLQLLQTVSLRREGKIIDVKSGVASNNHMYTSHPYKYTPHHHMGKPHTPHHHSDVITICTACTICIP